MRWGLVGGQDEMGTTIGCDNMDGGRLAAEHLIAHGRKHIAFLGDASDHYPEFRDRYLGAQNAISAAGHDMRSDLQVDALNTEQSGFDAAQQLISSGTGFDAIFAASDLIAIGAIRAIEDAGMTIPGDVAVIGFDDIPAASLAHPPLTTVQQDYRTAGEVLVDTLLKLIEGKSADSHILPTRLVVRKSCGAH